MRLRAFLTDVLADLEFAQLIDQPRPEDDAEKRRGRGGEGGAKGRGGEAAKGSEGPAEPIELFIQQVVKHQLRNLSSARSTWTPREPLKSSASPAPAISHT